MTIDATHEQTEECSDGKGLLESATVGRCNLQEAEDDHVVDHGLLPYITVTDETQKQPSIERSNTVSVMAVVTEALLRS